MEQKKFLLKEEDIKDLIEPMGYSVVSDKITIEGMKVGYMYRERPEERTDSGWRFMSGTEDEDYVEDWGNLMLLEVNVVANYDPAIIPFVKSRIGTEWERKEGSDDFIELKE